MLAAVCMEQTDNRPAKEHRVMHHIVEMAIVAVQHIVDYNGVVDCKVIEVVVVFDYNLVDKVKVVVIMLVLVEVVVALELCRE